MSAALRHPARPCGNCPWRRDSTPGEFTPERWRSLAAACADTRSGASAEVGSPLFACHKTPEGRESACAGWLAVEGHAHIGVRFAVLTGRLDPQALFPASDWPALYDSYAEVAEVNGVAS